MELDHLLEIGRIREKSLVILAYLEQKTGLKDVDHSLIDLVNISRYQKWTRDPFDRVISAQASYHDALTIPQTLAGVPS